MNKILKDIRKSALTALWIMILTFPVAVIKVNTIDNIVQWRWQNLIYAGVGAFFLSWYWGLLLERRDAGSDENGEQDLGWLSPFHPLKLLIGRLRNLLVRRLGEQTVKYSGLSAVGILVLTLPLFAGYYHVGVFTSALMFVILGLGLNIVIGYGGLLHLGYAAFYAVGAYSYGLLYLYLGLPFWAALPLGAVSGAVFGLVIGFPVLRLRGDYLAIVTLAFGEIVRLLLENLSGFTKGPEGIAQIPRPEFFTKLSLQAGASYLYYIVAALVLLTILVIRRVENSRLGRALEAMRDDEIAAQAMGIDLTRAKLTTFALGAVWAGMVGVILAAKTTYINPGSFTLMESVMILVAVVLGGTGSIPGVILGALLVTLVPEYLRFLSDYRMLMFGVVLVVMSIFKPEGIILKIRKRYTVDEGDSK